MAGESNTWLRNTVTGMQQPYCFPNVRYQGQQNRQQLQRWAHQAQHRSPLLPPMILHPQQRPVMFNPAVNEHVGSVHASGDSPLDLRRNRTVNTTFLTRTFTRSGPYHPSATLISAPFPTLPRGEQTANELQSREETENLPLDMTLRKLNVGVQSAVAKATYATPAEEETVTQESAPARDVQSTEDPRPSTSRKTSQEAGGSFKRRATDHPPASHPKRVSTDSHYGLKCTVIESAFNGRVFNSCIENTIGVLDPQEFLTKCQGLVIKEIVSSSKKNKSGIKMSCSLETSYLIQTPGKEEVNTFHFNSKTKEILQSTSLVDVMHEVNSEIIENLANFESRASSKSLFAIHRLVICSSYYNPICASRYIKLPEVTRKKVAVINIKNSDEYCFAWCMLASRYPAKSHNDRPSSYPGDLLFTEFNYTGINFPVSLEQVGLFEKHNPDVSVAVFALGEGFNVVPVLKPTKVQKHHVNLLVIEEEDEMHYCLISNISRLITRQATKHNGKMWLCEACMTRSPNAEALKIHKLKCYKLQELQMPKKGEILEFKAGSKTVAVPFVVYADIESILTKTHSCEPSDTHSWTRIINEHDAVSVAFQLVCRYDDSLSRFKLFRGANAVKDFLSELERVADEIIAIYGNVVPLHTSPQDELEFRRAKHCHICKKSFLPDDIRARDHCHVSGNFLGASHSECNLNRKLPNFLPIFFHCLSNYDSHFLIQHLNCESGSIACIAQSSERYISFSKKYRNIYLRFLDSYKFLGDKLSSLADMLEDDDFNITNAVYSNPEHLQLMKCKGVFPYTYLDSTEKLKDEQLPPKELFDNITDEEYRHAQKVWSTFNIKNLGEYSDLYLKTDTLLLADIYEKFRDLSLGMYNLDPCWFYTLPGLAFDAMLKITGVKIDLINDPDMIEFFEGGIRGGLCNVSKRYSKANHEYMNGYNPSEPSNFLSYWDINNLYGKAMASWLPHGKLRWLTKEEITSMDFMSILPDSNTGYVLEVDFKYPEHLHDAHRDLPLCPKTRVPPGGSQKKLIADLEDKEKYILHYRYFQQAVNLGLEVQKIYRVVAYKQSDWLKVYIDLNANKRAMETSKFGQNLWKLMNNAVYGKFIENVRKYRDFRIVSKWKQARKLIADPRFVRQVIFNENLVGIELTRDKVLMNKPIFIGQAILDLSKFIMYDFFYSVMKPQLNDLTLNYMDTDSFIFETSSDIYKFVKLNPQHFDTSNFPIENKYGIEPANKKVIGLFKDELGGTPMLEYIGLRSKLYSFRYDNHTTMKAKGVNNSGMQKLTFQHYFDCLKNLNKHYLTKQITFRSKSHKVSTIQTNKIAIHGRDDKRKLIEGSNLTLPWGHYSLRPE